MNAPEVEQYHATDAHTLEIIMKKPVIRRGKFIEFSVELREKVNKSSLPWKTVGKLEENQRRHRVKGLKSNTDYEFRVRGEVEYIGFSDYSKKYAFHTPKESESC